MIRLKNRNTQIPGGLRYFLPQTKWTTRENMSFQGIVDGLYFHLQGNPQVLRQLGWQLDKSFIADKVDEFNSQICKQMGWGDYIMEGGAPQANPFPVGGHRTPKLPNKPLLQSALNVAAGASTIAEMFGPNGPVDKVNAERRAATCLACPKHDKNSAWTDLFTEPAAKVIRNLLSLIRDMDLTTSKDANLHFCTVCDCPMKLKVFTRLDQILAHIPAEARGALPPNCWIVTEQTK